MQNRLRGWLREIGMEDSEECRWCGQGYEDGDHIVFLCLVLAEKEGGKEGEMEEGDLVEEFFSRIRDPEEDDEDHGGVH